MRNAWIVAALLIAGCAPPPPELEGLAVLGPVAGGGPLIVSGARFGCSRELVPEEWGIVTWPEMEPVPSVAVNPGYAYDRVCSLWLMPETPLDERWYAVHFVGPLGDLEEPAAAILLRDGTRVFRFHGVPPAFVTHLVTVPWREHVFLQAGLSQEIDPAPGHSWAAIMTVTQGAFSCPYPGPSISEDGASIGFFETLAVDCTGIDWNAPVHIHIEGAVARYGLRRPVPVIDFEHTFGVSSDSVALDLPTPTPEAPPPAPAEICAEACD